MHATRMPKVHVPKAHVPRFNRATAATLTRAMRCNRQAQNMLAHSMAVKAASITIKPAACCGSAPCPRNQLPLRQMAIKDKAIHHTVFDGLGRLAMRHKTAHGQGFGLRLACLPVITLSFDLCLAAQLNGPHIQTDIERRQYPTPHIQADGPLFARLHARRHRGARPPHMASPLTVGGQALYVPELQSDADFGPFMRIDTMPDLPV